MSPTRRSLALGGASLALAAAWCGRALAAASGFTVSGKAGPYIKQVAGRTFGWRPASGGALGLASDAINQGQYQQARLRMPRTEAAVTALINKLESQWPYAKGAPVQVFILGVDYYNAYALPDGSIVVSFGLLDRAGSDDEVAFVIGHELSHLLLGHFAGQGASAPPSLASRVGQMLLVGSATANAVAAQQAGATSDQLHFLVGSTAEAPHSQAQEDQADAMGFDLALAAAYAAEDASASVFDTIQADRVQRSAVETALQAQLKQQLGDAVTHAAAQAFLGGGLSASSLTSGILEIGATAALAGAASKGEVAAHRPPAERKKGIADYSAEAYPAGAPLREEQKTWLAQVRAAPEFVQARIAVEGVQECMKARAAGDFATATAKINAALASAYRGAPMVLCEAARLHADMGDTVGADRLFIQADASPDQSVDGALDHARLLYKTQQNDRCVQTIDAAIARFGGDDKPFIALQIAVARQAGRQDVADQLYGRCLSYRDQDLAQDCNLAAGKTQKPAQSHGFNPLGGLPGLPHF